MNANKCWVVVLSDTKPLFVAAQGKTTTSIKNAYGWAYKKDAKAVANAIATVKMKTGVAFGFLYALMRRGEWEELNG